MAHARRPSSFMASIDLDECARRGAIGAFGAIPGTLAAHPCDIVKMRQQVSGASTLTALKDTSATGVRGFYRGVGAGVTQKALTRGPMFLVSEVCTQAIQRCGCDRDVAVFCGSAGSGYATGFVASPAEWLKVQRGVGHSGSKHATVTELLRQSVLSSSGSSRRHGLARLHGAGCRNAVFDSTFFCSEHLLRKGGAPPAVSYGCAAALAVVVDFPLDAAVKRSMAVPPTTELRQQQLWPLRATWALVRERRAAVFAGLLAKVFEFAISYSVTGYCSKFLVR